MMKISNILIAVLALPAISFADGFSVESEVLDALAEEAGKTKSSIGCTVTEYECVQKTSWDKEREEHVPIEGTEYRWLWTATGKSVGATMLEAIENCKAVNTERQDPCTIGHTYYFAVPSTKIDDD